MAGFFLCIFIRKSHIIIDIITRTGYIGAGEARSRARSSSTKPSDTIIRGGRVDRAADDKAIAPLQMRQGPGKAEGRQSRRKRQTFQSHLDSCDVYCEAAQPA